MWNGERRNGNMITLKFIPEYVRIELRRNSTNQLLNNWFNIRDKLSTTVWFKTNLFSGNGKYIRFQIGWYNTWY